MNGVDRNKKPLILIADDQRFMRKMIRDALAEDDYEVIEAENGVEVVDLFQEYKPDIILIDGIMPVMDGFAACQRIREIEREETIPILMLTALGDPESVNEGFKAGVNDFIQKPLNFDILRRRISLLLKDLTNNERLRKSEERFRMLAENARDCIFLMQLHPVAQYEYVSPIIKNIAGYEPEEFYGKPELCLEIIHPEDRHLSITYNTALACNVEPVVMRVVHKNGELVYLENHYVPVYDKNKQIIGAQIIARDITQRKKDEERKRIELTQKVLYETVTALSTTIETRDPYTSGHQARVARLAVAIAKQMGLSNTQIEGIETAALLHDIGKITVPAEYLSKPGKLSEPEFNVIKTHSTVGYEILKPIHFPWPIADIVCQHHERINGSGYPHGLKGDQLLIETRIISVADVVEAMASHRPYREAMGIELALNEILRNAGVFYDPQVVSICIELFTEKGFRFSQ